MSFPKYRHVTCVSLHVSTFEGSGRGEWERAAREENSWHGCDIQVGLVFSGNPHWRVLNIGIADIWKLNVSQTLISCGIMEGAGTAGGRVFRRKLGHWGYALAGDIGTLPPPTPLLPPHTFWSTQGRQFFLYVPLP